MGKYSLWLNKILITYQICTTLNENCEKAHQVRAFKNSLGLPRETTRDIDICSDGWKDLKIKDVLAELDAMFLGRSGSTQWAQRGLTPLDLLYVICQAYANNIVCVDKIKILNKQRQRIRCAITSVTQENNSKIKAHPSLSYYDATTVSV